MRCSQAAENESLRATAPARRFWYVVEHPGPWPARPIEAAVLGDASDWILPLADRADTTVILARRQDPEPRVWFADTRTHDLAVGPLAQSPPEFSPASGRLTLVCTHGRRDQCCAILGRPLVDVIDGGIESSHIGGHRFAPTVLLLPEGILLGRCDPAAWPRVAGLGPEALPYYRGRTALPAPEQAVDAYAREFWGLGLIEPVEIRGVPGAEAGVYQASHGGSTLQVETHVTEVTSIPSCGKEPEHHTQWVPTARS